jgi:hypothetical protein
MFLMATAVDSNEPSKLDLADFHRRADAFFARFPTSKIIKRGHLDQNATGHELMAQLKAIAGIGADREAFQTKLENQLQRGLTAVPFAWRPKLVLTNVRDVVHLWEIAKGCSVDDKKYHLLMLNDVEWEPLKESEIRGRTPLLDLTALLVLFDLGLVDSAIQFFGRVAIAKSTLENLATLANPFSGSPAAAKCVDLQNALKPHLSSILQPSISDLEESDGDDDDDDNGSGESAAARAVGADGDKEPINERVLGREDREITRLCRRDNTYQLYSDDLFFRMLVSDKEKRNGICTLDVLAALREANMLTRHEAASKLSVLCGWNVGLVVKFDELVALLPHELLRVSKPKEGMDLLDNQPGFKAVIGSVWDFRAPFEKTLTHAAAILRRLSEESNLPDAALASIVGHWFVKAGLKNDAPPSAMDVLTKVILRAALVSELSRPVAKKLWNVFLQLLELHYGNMMDEQKEREAVRRLGAECGKLQVRNQLAGEAAHKGLRLGLNEGTSEDSDFVAAYGETVRRLQMPSGQKAR